MERCNAIQGPIMNSDENVGISIMKIVEELDSEPVINIYKLRLNPDDNAKDISENCQKLMTEKSLNNVDAILEDKTKFEEQIIPKQHMPKKLKKIEVKLIGMRMLQKLLEK